MYYSLPLVTTNSVMFFCLALSIVLIIPGTREEPTFSTPKGSVTTHQNYLKYFQF